MYPVYDLIELALFVRISDPAGEKEVRNNLIRPLTKTREGCSIDVAVEVADRERQRRVRAVAQDEISGTVEVECIRPGDPLKRTFRRRKQSYFLAVHLRFDSRSDERCKQNI
jgi:hypothetical protein